MLQVVDGLAADRQYRQFRAPPSPRAVFIVHPLPVRAYNRVIPLPLGLANIKVCSVWLAAAFNNKTLLWLGASG
jgi:hypothetical protein